MHGMRRVLSSNRRRLPAGLATVIAVVGLLAALAAPASASLTLPSVNLPPVSVPSVGVGPVHLPAVNVPAVHVPSVNVPSVHVPSVNVPSVHVPGTSISTPSVSTPSVSTPSVSTPSVSTPSVSTGGSTATGSAPAASTTATPYSSGGSTAASTSTSPSGSAPETPGSSASSSLGGSGGSPGSHAAPGTAARRSVAAAAEPPALQHAIARDVPRMSECLETLSPRMSRLLSLRAGLNGAAPESLAKAARALHLGLPAARRLEHRGLVLLRLTYGAGGCGGASTQTVATVVPVSSVIPTTGDPDPASPAPSTDGALLSARPAGLGGGVDVGAVEAAAHTGGATSGKHNGVPPSASVADGRESPASSIADHKNILLLVLALLAIGGGVALLAGQALPRRQRRGPHPGRTGLFAAAGATLARSGVTAEGAAAGAAPAEEATPVEEAPPAPAPPPAEPISAEETLPPATWLRRRRPLLGPRPRPRRPPPTGAPSARARPRWPGRR